MGLCRKTFRCRCRKINWVSSVSECCLQLHRLRNENLPLCTTSLIHWYLDMFMNELMSSNCVPTFLWDNDTLLNHIQDVFHEYDNSMVSTSRRLMKELGRYFSLPGEKILIPVIRNHSSVFIVILFTLLALFLVLLQVHFRHCSIVRSWCYQIGIVYRG